MWRDRDASRCTERGGSAYVWELVAGLVWLLAALSGPAAANGADAAAEPKAIAGDRLLTALDFSWCPAEVDALAVVRPAALLAADELRDLAAAIDESFPQLPATGLSASEVDAVALAWRDLDLAAGPQGPTLVLLRSLRAHDWRQAARRLFPQTEVVQQEGREYLKSTLTVGPAAGLCALVLDDRTLLVAKDEAALAASLAAMQAVTPPRWMGAWQERALAEAAGMVVLAPVRRALPELPPAAEQDLTQMFMAHAKPLAAEGERVILSAHLHEQPGLRLVLYAAQPEATDRLEKALGRLLELASVSVRQVLQAPPGAEGGVRMEDLPLLDLYDALLKAGKLTRGPAHVAWHSELPPGGVEAFAEAFLKSRQAERLAHLRHNSNVNLRIIGITMHNYHDVYGHLPAGVMLGPDKKAEYSWRVAFLPYLQGGNRLYEAYRFDQAWDSPANKLLLGTRPKVYGAGDVQSVFSDYYVFTGPETLFPGTKGLTFNQVTDGFATTIMAVEARHEIPWTKPEDLPYAADKPLPKLGGIFPGGFQVLFVDGSVHFLAQDIDQRVLRALITPAGGEKLDEQQ